MPAGGAGPDNRAALRQEARRCGIEERRRGYYFRTFSGKRNFAPPIEQSDWFELKTVQLDNGALIWSRTDEGRFPDVKELKQRIRDRVAPERALGHSDRR